MALDKSPVYHELARRAIGAADRSGDLQMDARRIRALGQLLREADGGERLVLLCAWCGRFRIGEAWLDLGAGGATSGRS